jgi:ABC-type polar amino acid transport system ATPase subunit
MTAETILSVSELHKSYGRVPVIGGVNLELRKGKVSVIIGPSGGGKSTLLRCFNLLETPNSGSITFDGEELFCADKTVSRIAKAAVLRKARSEMPMVFQNFNLFANRNIIDNVIAGPVLVQRRDKKEARAAGGEILAKVGLAEKQGFFPHELSGGQQQRVAIARALAMKPKVILFDEPTSALDPELVSGVLGMIKLLADDGMTLVIVTHEMGFARELADTVSFMVDGRILCSGTSSELFDNPTEPRLVDFVSSFRQPAIRAAAGN